MKVEEFKPRYRNLFIGIELPQAYLPQYKKILSELQKIIPLASPSTTQYPHLTLLFIGDVHEQNLEKIFAEVKENRSLLREVNVTVSELSYFRKNFPRVIFLKVKFDFPLEDFRTKMIEGLGKNKYFSSRKFHPHLTLCRLRSKKATQEFLQSKNEVKKMVDDYLWQFPVKKISIIARDREERNKQKVLKRMSI